MDYRMEDGALRLKLRPNVRFAGQVTGVEGYLESAAIGLLAGRFAELALACVHKEYPNKLAHVLSSDADVRPPRELTPAFYGCFDWHSAVHGHWLLVRLLRRAATSGPTQPLWSKPARAVLARHLRGENIAKEVVYLRGAGRASFERPYGLAWLLQLGRGSLLAYAFHIPLCYGRLARPFSGRLGMAAATLAVVALYALTYGVVAARDHVKDLRARRGRAV